ncbi:hypothetical protein JYU34_005954 [Plutella xylostella]|uniref:Mutant cadherin n=1 Tax=Plutella xylostella TaxID=51655 RepID=A0ABQ7QUJ8_PLUXY|nr:hypothetical protein JYU34_005954 [Plutella xylostella]
MQNDSLPPTTIFNNVNNRRGAWTDIDSGPIGLSQFHDSNDYTLDEIKDPFKSPTDIATLRSSNSEVRVRRDGDDSPGGRGRPASALPAQSASASPSLPMPPPPPPPPPPPAPNNLSPPPKAKIQRQQDNKPEEEWHVVSRRKSKTKTNYRYTGKYGMAPELDSFKAADKLVPIFITNVHSNTAVTDITTYLLQKTCEKVVLEKLNIKNSSNHCAYKFFVSKSKEDLFLSEQLWPKGIIFRKFNNYKFRDANRVNNGQTKKSNG